MAQRQDAVGALFPTPGNPMPAGGIATVLRTSDGVGIRAVRWRQSTRQALGTVCLATGRGEFIEKYAETVAELRRRGLCVVAFDWRGQGGSQRSTSNPRKGDVRDFAEYGRDLDAVTAGMLAQMPRPWFGLSHSMGGACYLAHAHAGRAPFARMVLVAPMVEIAITEGKAWPRPLALALRIAGLGTDFIPGGGETSVMTRPFAGNVLTADPERYARNAEMAAALPQLAVGDPTVRWLSAAFRQIAAFRAPGYPLEVGVPTLVVAAGADTVVSTPAIERFCARLKGGHAIVVPGARHEILMERDAIRERFWAAFDAFVPGSEVGRPDMAAMAAQEPVALAEPAASGPQERPPGAEPPPAAS